MASIQYERREEQGFINYEEQAIEVDALVKQAESQFSEDIVNESIAIINQNEDTAGMQIKANAPKLNFQVTALGGTLKNQAKGPMNVIASKKWAGHIVKNYPNPLNGVGFFAQSALSSKGVKAAVVYAGKNTASAECGWLLAWSDSKAGGRKIYAECGPKSKFNNVNWEQIEQRLAASGSIARCSDKVTGTSVYATLVGSSGKSVLGGLFSG